MNSNILTHTEICMNFFRPHPMRGCGLLYMSAIKTLLYAILRVGRAYQSAIITACCKQFKVGEAPSLGVANLISFKIVSSSKLMS